MLIKISQERLFESINILYKLGLVRSDNIFCQKYKELFLITAVFIKEMSLKKGLFVV